MSRSPVTLTLPRSAESVDMTAYRRKFRERPGELTPRNLDHPELVGLEDTGGGGVQEGPDLWEPLAWALLTPSSCSPPH